MDRADVPDAVKLAAIDIGTNTALFLAGEVHEACHLNILADNHAIPRLGEGVDHTRAISDAAFKRLISVLKEHVTSAEAVGINQIVATGTSVFRDAANREEIIARIKNDCGLDVRVLTGEEEAQLTFRGGTFESDATDGVALIDIGGGSTEISMEYEGEIRGVSFDIGAVRLTEKFLAPLPPANEQMQAASDFVRENLQRLSLPKLPSSLIAVAGTPTSLAAIELGLEVFDRKRINQAVLTSAEVESRLRELQQLTSEELVTRYPVVNRSRADILLGGTLILVEAMESIGIDRVTVSTRGLRYGVLIDALSRAGMTANRWSVND